MVSTVPPLSALSTVLSAHTESQNAPTSSSNPHSDAVDTDETYTTQTEGINNRGIQKSPHTALALQVQHNLQYQHNWTLLKLHTHSPDAPHRVLPRPLLSGLPPTRLYVHPDQQADEIAQQKAKRPRNAASQLGEGDPGDAEHAVEQEWVLPTHLWEKWSLKQFADVFDALGETSPGSPRLGPSAVGSSTDPSTKTATSSIGASGKQIVRKTKRVLLAMLSDDSTVNYYIVHDGLVKPRQN